MGKEVKEKDLADSAKLDGSHVKGTSLAHGILSKSDQDLVESFTTNENEAFLRMKEDPLMMIKLREMAERDQVYSNPMTLKLI